MTHHPQPVRARLARSFAGAVATVAICTAPAAGGADALTAEGRQFFESQIRPVLVEHCYECHAEGAKKLGGNLRLDSRDGILSGGESGPALVAGDPDQSLIVQALRWVDDLEMPPEEPLPETAIHAFEAWIKMGAPDPRDAAPHAGAAAEGGPAYEDGALWSFQPIQDPVPPRVQNADWPADPLDQFVLAKAEAAGLSPAADADPRVFIRRLTYDLTGLPPERGAADAFAADCASDRRAATERLVERLLASPRFGERWGRYWLDVARFAESNGNDGLGRNPTFPHAWRYRDYVIGAFNADAPYDRFVTEQIAGDLLPADSAAQRNRQLTATGFLAVGYKPAAAMNENFAMDVVDDQINAVSTGVMGLSVSCARCHDHKHDPIPTKDYYAMAGIFASTETLWGKAANEMLTAPPTPLHELKESLEPEPERQKDAAPPAFAPGYGAAVEALHPVLHARLDAPPERLAVEGDAAFTPEQFAELQDDRLRFGDRIPAGAYSVAFWFRNDQPNDAQPITAYLFSHAADGDNKQIGDHLGIGGKHDAALSGKLYVWNGVGGDETVGGNTVLPPGTWNHVVIVRDDRRIRVFLNGWGEPEIDAEIAVRAPENREIFIGARNDRFAPLHGAMAEVALFDRALGAEEARQLHAASGMPPLRPSAPLGYAMGARESAKIEDCKINIDGNSKKLGPAVPRGFLTACQTGGDPAPAIGAGESGRLQLAAWLTRGDHPQTARVMANRIWLHLFGEGIVSTPDDFGVYGSRPTHPELLDHLATRFAAGGWSVKRLIRAIVLSRTYGLASDGGSALAQADPDNRLLCRHCRRRLDAEALRDSLLAASGDLDLRPAQGSAVDQLDKLINWPPGEATHLHEPSNHRSVYLCMLRNSPPPDLAPFDFPSFLTVTGKRDVTIVPAQALFLMNSPLAVETSRNLARQLIARFPSTGDAEARAAEAFRLILRRDPSPAEQERAASFARAAAADLPERDAWASLCQGLMASNEFRYVD